MISPEQLEMIAAEILNEKVVIDEEAPNFPFSEFIKKVDYVLESNEVP
jgi:hypothetical protein